MASAQQQEKVLRRLQKCVDRTWGGYCVLHFTDSRLIVEKVGVTALQSFFYPHLLRLIVEFLSNRRTKAGEEGMKHEKGTPGYILASHRKNYALSYGEIEKVTLKRKITTWGYSELKVNSRQKKVTLGFKKEEFDDLASLLPSVIGTGKVEVI
jgi:hypothetical protein